MNVLAMMREWCATKIYPPCSNELNVYADARVMSSGKSRIWRFGGSSPFINETSILADLILPDHSPLESWLDDVPESGTTAAVASLAPPAIGFPLAPARQLMPDPEPRAEFGATRCARCLG